MLLAAVAVALAFIVPGGSDSEPGRIRSDSEPERIAFWQEGQGDAANLFVMNADETGRPRALVKGFDPTWSPDGERIAFTLESTFPESTTAVWVLPVADPGTARLLASLAPVYGQHLAWSPDGKKIAFSGVVTAKNLPNFDIYVMPATGGAVTALTRTPEDEVEPSWSPDGEELAYSRLGIPDSASPDIWVMNANGSEQRALTQSPDYDYSPAWSPDGERIAFQRQYPSPGAAINDEIVVVNVDGSDFRRLTRNRSFDDFAPAWSPGGDQIAFISERRHVAEVYVMNADGSALRRLTHHSPVGGYFDPAWAPSP